MLENLGIIFFYILVSSSGSGIVWFSVESLVDVKNDMRGSGHRLTQPYCMNNVEQRHKSTSLDLQEGLESESTELIFSTLESTRGCT